MEQLCPWSPRRRGPGNGQRSPCRDPSRRRTCPAAAGSSAHPAQFSAAGPKQKAPGETLARRHRAAGVNARASAQRQREERRVLRAAAIPRRLHSAHTPGDTTAASTTPSPRLRRRRRAHTSPAKGQRRGSAATPGAGSGLAAPTRELRPCHSPGNQGEDKRSRSRGADTARGEQLGPREGADGRARAARRRRARASRGRERLRRRPPRASSRHGGVWQEMGPERNPENLGVCRVRAPFQITDAPPHSQGEHDTSGAV